MDEYTATAVRTAFDDIVDATPDAPDWEQLTLGRAPLTMTRPGLVWTRGLVVATGVAALVLLVAAATIILAGGGDAPDSAAEPSTTVDVTTTNAVTTTAAPEPDAVDLRPYLASIEASSELPGFGVSRLVDGDLTTEWNDASLQGEGATIVLSFVRPVHLESLVFHNLRRDGRWERDFRIRGIDFEAVTIHDGQSGMAYGSAEVSDGNFPHHLRLDLDIVQSLTIRVTSTYPGEYTDEGPPFAELALAELELNGYPIDDIPPTVTTLPPTTTTAAGEAEPTQRIQDMIAALPVDYEVVRAESGLDSDGVYRELVELYVRDDETPITVWWQPVAAGNLVQPGDVTEPAPDGGLLVFRQSGDSTFAYLIGNNFVASITVGPRASDPDNGPGYPIDWIAPVAAEMYSTLTGVTFDPIVETPAG